MILDERNISAVSKGPTPPSKPDHPRSFGVILAEITVLSLMLLVAAALAVLPTIYHFVWAR